MLSEEVHIQQANKLEEAVRCWTWRRRQLSTIALMEIQEKDHTSYMEEMHQCTAKW